MVNDLSGFGRGVYGDFSNTSPLTAQAFQNPFVATSQIPGGLGSQYAGNFGGQSPYNVFSHIPYNVWNPIAQTNPFCQVAINPLYHPSYGMLMNAFQQGCAPQFANSGFQQIPYGGQIPYGTQIPYGGQFSSYQGHPLQQTNAFSAFNTTPFNNVWGFNPVACR